MKVYCTPVKITCTSGRYSASSFFSDNAKNFKNSNTGMDYSNADKSVFFRFFEDSDIFACVILTIKKSKSYVSASQINKDFALKVQGTGNNSISEANILILNRKNLKGIYIHNEGSMLLSSYDSKLREHYYGELRAKLVYKKRDEKFVVERMVDNATLADKIEKYSFVDEINATFVSTKSASRFLNSSVYSKTKSVRVTMRTNNLSIKTKTEKKDLVDYLSGLLTAQAGNVSFKGKNKIDAAGDTVGIIDKANSIQTLDHDDYLTSLNGMKLSAFLSSNLFIDMKKLVMSHSLLK